jgi:hypothetical protein
MSSKENNELSVSVPILIGPNWIIWKAQMRAYLRTQGLWQLVIGNKSSPEELPSGCVAQAARTVTATTPARDAIDSTVPFQSIRPSRVTGLVVLAEIHWLSHVTGGFEAQTEHPSIKKQLKRLNYVRKFAKLGRWPNSKFHPPHHRSHLRPN